MQVTLTAQHGPRAGRSVSIFPGQVIQVGRSAWADLALPDAPALADLHFAIECGKTGCTLRDLGTNGGTHVNGSRVARGPLRDGDRIEAGGVEFLFLVHIEATSSPERPARAPDARASRPAPAPPAETVASAGADLIGLLSRQPGRLFAVLDAAREPSIPMRLAASDARFESLYEGEPAVELAAFAPYLVALDAGSALLVSLADEGWGLSWGVFLACGRPFDDVRKHLRRFLLVQDEGGKSLYFRFYDPRVLRIFLPTCHATEAAEFFGPIDAYLCEADDPATLLRFSVGPAGVRRESVGPVERSAQVGHPSSATRT